MCKFSSSTEDFRKSNETLPIMVKMEDFASILIEHHYHEGRPDPDIYESNLFFREKKKKDESSYRKEFQ